MKQIKMQKQIKQTLYLKGYQTNPHGFSTPIYSTVAQYDEPVMPPQPIKKPKLKR